MDTRLRFKGEFDYHAFYTLVKEYFVSRGFEFYETRYKDKGNEFEVEWTCERAYDEYHLVKFSVDFHLWDVEKKRVERYGKPQTIVKARVEISIDGDTVYDYGGGKKEFADPTSKPVFGKDRASQFFKKVFEWLTERERDEHWDDVVAGLLMGLSSEIKGFFGMRGVN